MWGWLTWGAGFIGVLPAIDMPPKMFACEGPPERDVPGLHNVGVVSQGDPVIKVYMSYWEMRDPLVNMRGSRY